MSMSESSTKSSMNKPNVNIGKTKKIKDSEETEDTLYQN